MAKVLIPTTGIYRVYRNNLELDPKIIEKQAVDGIGTKNIKPLNVFSNINNTYVLNIPKTVNSIREKASAFWRTLNILGDVELNCPCPIDLRMGQHSLEKNEDDFSWSYGDYFGDKSLTINSTSEKESSINFQLSAHYLNKKDDKLEKLTLKADKISAEINKMENLKEITLDCTELLSFKPKFLNCKRVNLPRIKLFKIGQNYYNDGWKIFETERKDFNTPNVQGVPDNCIVTINKNCDFSIKETLMSQSPLFGPKEEEDETFGLIFKPLKDFINKNTAKSYVENPDGTISIKFSELKLLVNKEIIDYYKQLTNKATRIWETEKQIIHSMIPDKKKQNIKKI